MAEVLYWVSLCAASLCSAVLAIFSCHIFEGFIFSVTFPAICGWTVSVGSLLASGRRGIVAGLITTIVIPIIWYFTGAAQEIFGFIDNELQIGLTAAAIVALLELTTADVQGQARLFGLGVGLAVGLFMIFVKNSLVGSFYYTGNDALLLFSFYSPNALVWLSALFFPEWISRKVGYGGVIVWMMFILVVLGLSLMLLK